MLPVILQARMGSSRLPGKVLLTYRNETLLEIQISRLRKCPNIGEIIVATSDSPQDEPIVNFCKSHSLPCVVGAESHVVNRFVVALSNRKDDGFVRFCADRPLFDWRILDRALRLFELSGADIVTNAAPSTFPKGQTIEIVKREIFLDAAPLIIDPSDQEHVMTYFYKRKDEFRIENFTVPNHNYNSINLCVDSQEDFDNFKRVATLLGENYKNATWEESLRVYREICAV